MSGKNRVEDLERFDSILNNYKDKGYKEKEYIYSNKIITYKSIFLMAIFSILIQFFYSNFLADRASVILRGKVFLLVLILIGIILFSLVIHELLHGIGWSIGTEGGFSNIKIFISNFMPMCTCYKPLRRNKYLFGVLLPFVVLGGISFIFMVIFPNNITLLLTVFNFAAASGDILLAIDVIKSKKDLIIDHPTKAGFVGLDNK